MARFVRILKATRRQEKDERKAKREAQREARKAKKKARQDKKKQVRVVDAPPPNKEPKEAKPEPPKEEPPKNKETKPPTREIAVRDRKKGKTEKAFESLQPYMNNLMKRHDAGEIDIVDLYTNIINANNLLIGQALGMDESALYEAQGDIPAIMAEPLINAPVMMHLQRMSNKYPELKEVRAEDEEDNGSLEDLMEATKGIRADISSFIADPINMGRPHQQKDINGIYKLLARFNHPLAVTLGEEIPKSDKIAPNYKPRRPRQIRVRGKMTDRDFEGEMNRLAREQSELLSGRTPAGSMVPFGGPRAQDKKFYDEFFSQTDIDRGPKKQTGIVVKRPSTAMTKNILEKVKQISREEALDDKDAFNSLQDKFNNFMISLTGNKAFGTSGRAGKFGGEIETGRAPNALTPSMAEVGKQLGIGMPAPNIPDMMLKPHLEGKSPFSMELRDALAVELGPMDKTGFHPSLVSSTGEDGLLSSLLDDETKETTEGAGFAGTKEEIEEKASEARRARIGGVATESSMMEPEDELAVVQGKRKMSPSQKMAELERRLQQGDIDDYEYEMQRLALQMNQHKIDSDKELGGLSGDDFDVNHAFFGLNENQIMERSQMFVDNLIGMGRVIRELRYEAHRHSGAETPEQKKKVDNEIAAMGLDAQHLISFGNIDNAPLRDILRYNRLDDIMNGKLSQVMPRITSQMNRQHKMMKDMGLSDVDVVNAAMKYANADMSISGYKDAFKSLLTQKRKEGDLKSYPIYRLLQYLQKKGLREAMDEEHHQKVMEQQKRFERNHAARKTERELGSFSAGGADLMSPQPEHISHLLEDKEECLSCHPDRFGNRTAQEARLHSPFKRERTPFAHKSITMPLLTDYKEGKGRGDARLYAIAPEGQTSLASIVNHIYPGKLDIKKLLAEEERVKEDRQRSVANWRKDKTKKYKRLIKDAVLTGNPRAANIYKKFGLYKTIENAIATGPAGMSNKELVAASFFMNNDDSIDKFQEMHRKKTLMATRFNAITDAIDFMKEIAEGQYGGKIKPGALKSESLRRALLSELVGGPIDGIQRADKSILRAKRSLESLDPIYRQYLAEQKDYEEKLAQTKMQTYIDEDGNERQERGQYMEPSQIAMIEEIAKKIDKKYSSMLLDRKNKLSTIKRNENKKQKLQDASEESLSRVNEFMLGVFIKAGGDIAKILNSKKPTTSMVSKLYEQLYEDDDFDSIHRADTDGNLSRDFTHSLSNYKLGRMGEMAGTGIMAHNNNKALPRVNNINQLLAHRIAMGFPLKEDDIERAKSMMFDAEMTDAVDDEDDEEFMRLAREMMTEEEIQNLSEKKHHHHDDSANELGLITEAEAARREQNSHFTRGSEEAIERGDINAQSLISNWRQHAPTLCGTCHGHKFVTKDEAISFLRHRIPELEGVGRDSPRMMKYISQNLRPRGTQDFASHEMADEMEDHEHEQFACPACEHSADYVQGGKCSNGLCPDCLGSGVRDPLDDEHIHDGYTDAEGNKIDGKNHHYSHNGAVGAKFDHLNQLLLQGAEMMQSGKIPDFLQEVVKRASPVWQQYGDYVGTGKYKTIEDKRNAARKKELEPLEIDPNAPEIPGPPREENEETADNTDMNIDFGQEKPKDNTDMNIDFGQEKEEPRIDIPLYGVQKKALDSHHKIMLENRINQLEMIGVKTQENAGNADAVKMIKDLAAEIRADPAFISGEVHGNDMHPLVDKIHKLQEYAEAAYVASEMGFDDRRKIPYDEKGNILTSVKDIFAGDSPLTFADYEPLTPMHGHNLTLSEIAEGLFEDGATHSPRPIDDKRLADLFRGNNKAMGVINRRQQYNKLDKNKLSKIASALDGIDKPMVARKTTNLRSDSLDAILKEFGEEGKVSEMDKPQLTYSDETMNAFKQAGATDVNALITAPNANKQNRAINEGYNVNLNSSIKELWQEYVLKTAMRTFMTRVNNPLDFPKIPENITPSNMKQLVGEDVGLFKLLRDEAAKLCGYENEDEFSKKVGLTSKIEITDGKGRVARELNPREFKADVMQNANHEDSAKLDLGFVKYQKDDEGNLISAKFTPTDLKKLFANSQKLAFSAEDKAMYDGMVKSAQWHHYPNWYHRDVMRDVLQGQEGKEDGFSDYDELSQAFQNGLLPPEIDKRLKESLILTRMSHPTLNHQNYGDMLAYDHARQEMLRMQRMSRMQRYGTNPYLGPTPTQPTEMPQQQQQQPAIDFEGDSQ